MSGKGSRRRTEAYKGRHRALRRADVVVANLAAMSELYLAVVGTEELRPGLADELKNGS